MVEVVVSLAKTEEGRDPMVARRASVVERLVAQVMAEAVDGEGALLNRHDPEDASVDQAAAPVTPAQACHERREDPAKEDGDGCIVFVLPDDKGVVGEIADVGAAVLLVVLVEEEPAHVSVPN